MKPPKGPGGPDADAPPPDAPPSDAPPPDAPPPDAPDATLPAPSDATRDSEELPPLPLQKTPEIVTKSTIKNQRRTALVVLAPLVSVATLMVGLRVGAGGVVHAATVFAAPPGKPPTAGAPAPLALQVLTYLEDRKVREIVAMREITVVARSKGKESRWTGASNADGIAEASLAFADLSPSDRIAVEVLVPGEAEPLATGTVDLRESAALTWARDVHDTGERAAARPSKREGSIGLDVLVEGERLVVGFDTTLWAHVLVPGPGMDASRVSLTVTPEAGLRVEGGAPKIACDGWADVRAVAQGHVVGIQIEAKDPEGRSGVWFGALPVAPGAFFVGAPRSIPAGKASEATLVAPNPRTVVYAEVDDESGRVFAAALPLVLEPGDPVPRAHFAMPPLAPGLHWIVVSGEPRGAERLAGAAIAKPFLVGDVPGVRTNEPCSIGPWLARRPAVGFPRWLAVDGMETRGASNRLRYRAGLAIGLLSLLAASVLEALLLTAASREARAMMLLAEFDEPEAERMKVTASPPGGGLAIALLVALLGFALLAALMVARG